MSRRFVSALGLYARKHEIEGGSCGEREDGVTAEGLKRFGRAEGAEITGRAYPLPDLAKKQLHC